MTSRFVPPLQPVHPKLRNLLAKAQAFRQAGQLAQSVGPMTEATKLDPTNVMVWHDLGLTNLQLGRPQLAAAAFRQAATRQSSFVEAHWRLGIALEEIGDAEGAIAALNAAIALRPALGEAHYRLAALLLDAGRRTEAIVHYRLAETSTVPKGLQRLARARALIVEGRDGEALEVLRTQVAESPTDVVALDLMGVLLSEAGAFEEAAETLEQALTLAPATVGAYYDLVRCRKLVVHDPLITRMLEARDRFRVAAVPAIRLNLALGKAYDDVGQFADAMAAFDTADGLRTQVARFIPTAFDTLVQRVIEAFPNDRLAQAASLGDPDPTPVLIVGLPRSGTTLCEQILSSHPHIAGGGELPFWSRRGRGLMADGGGPADPEFLRQAAVDALSTLRLIGPDARRVTDKDPFNFLWLGLIHLVFPNATLIHCRRDLTDTALSIHQTYFSPKLNFPTGGADLVAYITAYRRLMDHWRAVLPADRFIEVDYESLTADPEPDIRRMVAATGLAWDNACLAPERNDRAVKTPSKWQARQPINRGSVGRSGNYLSCLGPLAALRDL